MIDHLTIGRRRFLTLTAASVSAMTLGTHSARAAETIRWVSPRGTVEVLDDYPYWVAKKFGYFGAIETTLEPGPSDATATVKLVDQNQADVGYPSPGVFSLALAQGTDHVELGGVVTGAGGECAIEPAGGLLGPASVLELGAIVAARARVGGQQLGGDALVAQRQVLLATVEIVTVDREVQLSEHRCAVGDREQIAT